MLEARISKARREFVVEVELRVASGQRLAIFGASGMGKSTVLSCIAGFQTPDAGMIRCDGELYFPPPLSLFRRRLGYLSQSDFLFPHLTVERNVRFGLRGQSHKLSDAWIAELRERLGLAPLWRAPVQRISGGQARRVAMARMLAPQPRLVLLDEPFRAMDRALVDDLLQALDEWQTRLGFMLIAVDHRSDILRQICPQVAVMECGRVVQTGTWEELAAAPATPLLARLLAPPAIPDRGSTPTP